MTQEEALSSLVRGTAGLAGAVARGQTVANTTLPLVPPFSNMTQADWARSVRLWLEHGAPQISTQPDRLCPVCAGTTSRWLFTSYDGYPFNECEVCGCWYVSKKVDTALFDAFFARCPEASKLAAEMTVQRAHTLQAADLDRIGGYLDDLLTILGEPTSAGIAYLDTGCGVGHSLQAAARRGLRAHGIEVDAAAIATARSEGLSVTRPSDPPPAGPFQLMSFLETLEHINDPFAVLQQYLPLLDAGGLVTVTVPNLDSPTVRILRGDCSYVHGGMNTPGHINFFHLSSLTRLLERTGLVVLDADAEYSNNPMELAGYLISRHRSVHDMLTGRKPAFELPSLLHDALNAAWPGISLIERLALTAPILKVLACRPEDAGRYADRVAELQRTRRREMARRAQSLVDATPYSQSLRIRLQEELNRRIPIKQFFQKIRQRLSW